MILAATLMTSPELATSSAATPRPLGTSFGKNGYHYEQVVREGNVAIFRQRLRPGEGELAFEVIVIKVVPESTMFGKVIPAREVGPSNEDFGKLGWTYPELSRAKAKMAEVLAKGVSQSESRGSR